MIIMQMHCPFTFDFLTTCTVGYSQRCQTFFFGDFDLVPNNTGWILKPDRYTIPSQLGVVGIEYRSIYLANGTTVLQLRRLKLSAWQKAKCEAITIQIGSHSYMAGMEYRGDSMSRDGFLSHQLGPLVGSSRPTSGCLESAHPLDPIICCPPLI